ncbi:rhamnan synthesis F family protein [Parasphingopyxis sp.]|uniref:rhamnan synthesis F family protein n=1 Tax=Parasphingopyxis sp. TaxID=1920299 RepID=UPI00262CF19A|nr:rhamnan synthesis F family protein [Parasphingopyxis sp.]
MALKIDAWNWHKDGWLQTEGAIRVTGCEEISINLYIPNADDWPENKRIAIFDGQSVHHVELHRGKLHAMEPIHTVDGDITLQFVSEYLDNPGAQDNRRLGFLLNIVDPPKESFEIERTIMRDRPARLTTTHPETDLIRYAFDEEHYCAQFEMGAAPHYPIQHYLMLGWMIGRDPNAEFANDAFIASAEYDAASGLSPLSQYCLQNAKTSRIEEKDEDRRHLDAIWRDYIGAELYDRRPNFRFDIDFYQRAYRDLEILTAKEHFDTIGRREGRPPNRYHLARSTISNLDGKISKLVRDEALAQAIVDDIPHAAELAFELIGLGEPVDRKVSDFSAKYYRETYSDIDKPGLDAWQHYLSYGFTEGRFSLKQLRENMIDGEQLFDPDRPTCLIASHDFSRTGAPAVALKLAQEATKTCNVVALSLRDGSLLDDFAATSSAVIVTENPAADFQYFEHPALESADFAILNSVESFAFIREMVARGVPFGCYIHEYKHYTFPYYKTKIAALYSDTLAFSSESVRDSWAGVFEDTQFDVDRDSYIIPQERLPDPKLSASDFAAARERVSRIIGADLTGKRVIYGAGQAQMRKGTDLFIVASQHARDIDPSAVFIWIGDGQNHEDIQFGAWLDFQMQQAGANDPDGNLFFLPAGDYYFDVCKAADAMFLSSRLDPLPNVVFDAIRFANPVIMFENASGFCDETYAQSPLLETVPYGDSYTACRRLLARPTKTELLQDAGGAIEPTGTVTGEHEAPPFTVIRSRLDAAVDARGHSAEGDGEFDVAVLFAGDDEHTALRARERAKIWHLGRRMIWRNQQEAEQALKDEGEWMHARSRIVEQLAEAPTAKDAAPDFAVHMHAYYVGSLAQDLESYRALQDTSRLVFTTDTDSKAARIQEIADSAGLDPEIRVVPNRGRDILPFMELIDSEPSLADAAIWCHLHQKQSIGSASGGAQWHRFLMEILLGDQNNVSSALGEITDRATGLVTAMDPHIVGWEASRRQLPLLETLLGRPLPDSPVMFPVGNMFWTKTSVVRRMNALFGDDYGWPNEPIPNDGTIYHAIERLWPAVTVLSDLDSVFLKNSDVKRI